MKKSSIVSVAKRGWNGPSDTEELRVAILGAGKMARLHLEALQAMPGVRVVAICNPASDAGNQLAGEYRIEHVYRDANRLLDEVSCDAVIVAVSHQDSYDVASLVLERGISCLLEKPAGYSAKQVRLLADLATSQNCRNLVGLNRRFYSVINQALLAVTQQGPVLGVLVEAHEPILEYRSRGNLDAWVYDNWFVANTIHAIDLLRMIAGEVVAVSGFGRRNVVPNGHGFSIAIEFEQGVLGTFVSHWNSTRGTVLKIYGNEVTAELGPLEEGFLRYDSGHRIKLIPDWTDVKFKPGLYAQNARFLSGECDHASPAFPASDLRDNIKTMELIERISELAA